MAATPPARADRSGSGHGPAPIARRGLFERLSTGSPAGVTLVSAPAGSGKTVLLRSWIDEAGLADHVAWVTVERGERDPQRFWLAVVEKLRTAVGADAFVEKLTPAPEFDGAAVVERLISGLGSLEDPVLLVLDDLQELQSPEALSQLALLLDRRPRLLRVVLATRRDPQLGLHRLRLAGELTEVRAADLRFTLDETRELLAASGIALSEDAARMLHSRTEGWAAGLRLAALSLAGHPDPERFVAEFSGSERTVADYLLAEVLQREPQDARRLLLRTSILERVTGALADVLVEATGSERILLELEQANAFVVSVDAERTWFRYHELFADLLRLELRRTEPRAVAELHRRAAAWLEEHGLVADAIRHAQAAADWPHAARLVADHSFSLSLDGQDATMHALLGRLPGARPLRSGAGQGRCLRPAGPRHRWTVRPPTWPSPNDMRQRSPRSGGTSSTSRWGSPACRSRVDEAISDPSSTRFSRCSIRRRPRPQSEIVLGNDARAVALMDLGAIELWSFRHDDAERHLEQGLELASRIPRPYIQIGCLAYLALAAAQRWFTGERERSLEAIAIAEAHGWEAEPIACIALATLGAAAVHQGRFEEAQYWLERAERALRPDLEPAEALLVHFAGACSTPVRAGFTRRSMPFASPSTTKRSSPYRTCPSS